MEQTRRIANVRIHVERVIGNIRKKYRYVLGATQPIDFVTVGNGEVTTPDEIVTSCTCNVIYVYYRTLRYTSLETTGKTEQYTL